MDRPTRHRRRFHTDRIVRARRARYLREAWIWHDDAWLREKLAYGRLASTDPWDCGHPRCGLCHSEPPYVRHREERRWHKDWNV